MRCLMSVGTVSRNCTSLGWSHTFPPYHEACSIDDDIPEVSAVFVHGIVRSMNINTTTNIYRLNKEYFMMVIKCMSCVTFLRWTLYVITGLVNSELGFETNINIYLFMLCLML